METKLIKIGNSFGVRIPKALIQQYDLSNDIEIDPTVEGILIKSKKKARAGWQEQLTAAIDNGHAPDEELLEGFTDGNTDKEWQW
jgi:antitoxin MazE